MHYQTISNPYFGLEPVTYMNHIGYPFWESSNQSTESIESERNVAQKYMNLMQQAAGGHTHAHYGSTTCQDGHNHLHPGVTSTPIQTQGGHVHIIFGNTTFDDGHIHYYEEYTSPSIPLPNGYHTHYVEIRTTENDGHIHIIKGFTAPSKS